MAPKAANKPAAGKKEKAASDAPKKPNAFQLFMKDEIARLKAHDKNLKHKEAFTLAAHNWSKNKSA